MIPQFSFRLSTIEPQEKAPKDRLLDPTKSKIKPKILAPKKPTKHLKNKQIFIFYQIHKKITGNWDLKDIFFTLFMIAYLTFLDNYWKLNSTKKKNNVFFLKIVRRCWKNENDIEIISKRSLKNYLDIEWGKKIEQFSWKTNKNENFSYFL